MNGIVELIKYFESINNPAIAIVFILSIVFLLFYAWRKLTTNEYVTAGKEAFDEQKKLYDDLKSEHVLLKKDNQDLRSALIIVQAELDENKQIIEYLKEQLNEKT